MIGSIFILGDSYSTFEDYIPDGYAYYYATDGPNYVKNDPNLQLGDNDVSDVTQTWWYNLAKENGKLLKNCSWSGTTICNTGYGGADCCDNSFIARIDKLIEKGYFAENKVDTLFLFGGTNDSWSNAPLGEAKYSDWTKADLYNVLPAFSYLIDRLVKNLPDTKIYCIINTELKNEISEFYKSVCNKENVDVIELYDIEKVRGHPTVKGMKSIKEQILDYINERKKL